MAEADARMQKLEAALHLYLSASADPDPTALHALVEQNPDLRELLEPMLAGPGTEPGPPGDARLGDFRLLGELGRGGMGVVHDAEQLSLGRRVALKILPQGGASATAILRLRREAAIAASLDHPGIVKVFASGIEGENAWVAMERIEGLTLAHHVADVRAGKAAHSIVAMTRIAAEVAEALGHAHERGVSHRDVKPSNVLLRPDGHAVLSDFGLARQQDGPSLTQSGDIAGTPHYMAPEQAQGENRRVGPRSDVFALGAMLYELLTLVRPFAGDSSLAVLQQIVHAEPKSPDRHNPDLPDDLVAIVLKALAKDPAHRYADGSEFAADLRAFLAHRPVVARRAGWWDRARGFARREPAKATLVLVLALGVPVLAGLLIYLRVQGRTIEVGEATLRQGDVHRALADGYYETFEGTNHERARAHFQHALELDPGCEEAVAGLATAAYRGQGAAAALALLGKHHDGVARSVPLQRLEARLLYSASRVAEANAILARLGDPRGAVDLFIAGTHEMLLAHQGERAAFARAAVLLRRAVLAAERPLPHMHFEWAHAVGHVADRTLVDDVETSLLSRWENLPQAWYYTAFAWDGVDQQKAVRIAERGTERFPRDLRLRIYLGNRHLHDNDVAGARRELDEARKLETDNVHVRELQVEALIRSKLWKEAEQELRTLIASHPDHPDVLALRGMMLSERGDPARAVEWLEKALAKEPDNLRALLLLGIERSRLRQFDRSRDAFNRLLAIEPNSPATHTNLGVTELNAGRLDLAEQHLRRALELGPRGPETWLALAIVLENRGDTAGLRTHVEAWLVAHPEDPAVRPFQEKLGR